MNHHKTKAEEFLEDARNYGAGSALEASALTAAQVHATLALVDQQRIANLIAMFALDEADMRDFTTRGITFPQLAVEITDGLAL